MSEERGVIILINSQKGGVGKSTIATNLAVCFAMRGHDAVLVDADPQGNTTTWSDVRNEKIDAGETLPRVHCVQKTGDLKATAIELAKKHEAVVIDAAGRDSREMRTGLMVCDISIIPCQASAFDLVTMDHMSQVLEDTHDFNPNRIVRTLVSMAPTNLMVKNEKDAREYLNDYADIMPLSKNRTRFREAYKTASLLGKGVVELSDPKAKAEISLIFDEILSLASSQEDAA